MDEKNSILALKVNAMGGTERIPYVGASALTDDVIPTVEAVTGGAAQAAAAAEHSGAAQGTASGRAGVVIGSAGSGTVTGQSASGVSIPVPNGDVANAPVVQAVISEAKHNIEHRFPKLALVDEKYAHFVLPEYDNDITLEDFVEALPPCLRQARWSCIIHLRSSADLLPVWRRASC